MAIVNGKSGTFNIYTNNTSISGYVKWQETYDNSTYATTNKTTVTLTAYLHRTNIYSGTTWFDGFSVTRTAYFGSETVSNTSVQSMSIAGSSSNGTPTSGGGAFTQVYTASKEITHDSDGGKSITVGFAMSNNVGGVAGDSFTVGKTTSTISLTTVPRATTPTLSATSITMGTGITVTMNPASSSFKHKLRYDFGSVSGSANGFSIGAEFTAQGNTSATFTPPTSLGNQIPSAMSGTGTLICYTYASDGTHIGTKTVGITLNVPAYTPTISGITMTGNNLLSSTYVQGKSTVTVSATLGTSYGASTKSVSAVIDGKTYTTLPFTTSALSSGDKSVAITFTDTRNKSVTVTSSAIKVYEYFSPNITGFSLTRQSDGTTVIATVQGTIAAVNNKNAKTIQVTLNGVTNTITSSSYTINGTTTFTGVPTDSTFTATASFKDSYVTIQKQATLPTVAVTMDFHHSGNGIAMGKVAESGDLLDVAWNQRVRKNLTIDGSLTVAGKTLLNWIYPVGSIYMSVNATSPATLFGGTWVQLKDRFLLGVGDTYTNGATGGAATHTLSVAEMPTHGNHLYTSTSWIGQGDASGKYLNTDANMSTFGSYGRGWNLSSNEAYPAGHTTGGGGAHNNMPPYLAVYMWKRTA